MDDRSDQQRDTAQQARDAVAGSAARVRETAESQKNQAAGRLEGTADALHEAANALHERNESSLASYVEQFAGMMSEFSGSLRDRSAGEVLGQVESIARRNPALFLGGAFAAGVALGRFARSSARHDHDHDDRDEERFDRDDDRVGSRGAFGRDRDAGWEHSGDRDTARRDVLGGLPPHGDDLGEDADLIRREPLGSEQAPRPDTPGDPSI